MRIMMCDRVHDALIQNFIAQPFQVQSIHHIVLQEVGLVKVACCLYLAINIRPKVDHGDVKLLSDFNTSMGILHRDIVGPVQGLADCCQGSTPHLSIDRCRRDQDDLGVGRVVGRVWKADGVNNGTEILLVCRERYVMTRIGERRVVRTQSNDYQLDR
jgi:hypothetical protein